MNSYLTEFEKIQKIKTDLFKHNKASDYSENENSFVTPNLTVNKNKYFNRIHKLNRLIHELSVLNNTFLSMKSIYLMSRSKTYTTEIKEVFSKIKHTQQKIEALKKSTDMYIMTNTLKQEEKPKDADEEKPKMSSSKKQKVKKFLFNTYEQCISRKTSSPTYMSKEDIIKHIKENDPNLVKFLPKKLQTLKKEEICKVLFQ
tara:strand:- start:282 stop:884 length:603 start_codon:yes stop_codon:yes gene_type:complete